ncbi:GmrSD restriction endonuclease domain-containing protein [Streptomyces sp. KR55]|uniref:GmrSD restriction endonuclease domain-containing protein n=1 Tax=Streptomyces sp. KR55 TaxID=3457425 RepID=UPI003FD0CFE0
MTSAYESDPIFETVPRQLSNLVTRIHGREIALPDFQRDFVWDATRTEELIQSIISEFPVGTLLLWKQGDGETFASRSFEGAPELGDKRPAELVLDGQQRLTALYQALTGVGDERFYLKVDEFVDVDQDYVREFHEVNFDKAVISVPFAVSKGQARKNEELLGVSHFPVSDVGSFDDWLDEYVDTITSTDDSFSAKYLKSLYRRMRDKYIVPLRSYGLPVLTLPETTPIEAVCTIFETLNRTGKPLGPFELLTARYYPQGVNLRDLWLEALGNYKALVDFKVDPYSILQAVCLKAYGSAQRSDVLKKLTAADISQHWSSAVKGIAGVIDMLQSDCGLVAPKWLPYGMLLIPMGAVWGDIQKLEPLDRASAYARLQQFFWCSVFTTNYDQGANSQAGADYARLKEWVITGDGQAPEALAELPLSSSTLRSASVRRKALYCGLMCLLATTRAEDFHTGQAMTPYRVGEVQIDSHHIFPKAYLARTGGNESSELLLNRTLIDAETNRIIKDKAPSQYLGEMAATYGEEKLESVLASHAIKSDSSSGLANDDYGMFLDERLKTVVQLIERVTGRSLQEE